MNIYKCNDCDAVMSVEGTEVEPLYECQNCGTRFTTSNSADGAGHRCPDCNKFAAKVTDNGCPECGEGELEIVEGYVCDDCGDAFEDHAELIEHTQANHPGSPLLVGEA